MRQKQTKTSTQMVNLCNGKQVTWWFRQRKVDEAYLECIQLVKDEQEVVPIVPEKMSTRCHVEKALHKKMPKYINVILQEYKDIFPMDLPPRLLLVQMGHEFKIELEDDTLPIHRPIYKLSPLELKEAKEQTLYMLEHGYI